MKNIFAFLILGLALVSCKLGKDTEQQSKPTPPDPEPTKKVEVSFGSFIQGTKASETAFEAGDQIGIYMINSGNVIPNGIVQNAANRMYATLDNSGKFMPTDVNQIICFPMDINQKTDFVSYYPFKIGAEVNHSFNISVEDQSTLNNDLNAMFSNDARGKDKTNPEVNMTFKHILSKLTFNIQPGTGLSLNDLVGLVIKIDQVPTNADFSLISQSFDNFNPANNQINAICAPDGRTGYAVILPHNMNSGMNFKFITNSGNVHTYMVPTAHDFAMGTKYNYTITLSQTEILVQTAITPWEQGEDREGDADLV